MSYGLPATGFAALCILVLVSACQCGAEETPVACNVDKECAPEQRCEDGLCTSGARVASADGGAFDASGGAIDASGADTPPSDHRHPDGTSDVQSADGAVNDANQADGTRLDANQADGTRFDANQVDGTRFDANLLDVDRTDADLRDAVGGDAGGEDVSSADAAIRDAYRPDAQPTLVVEPVFSQHSQWNSYVAWQDRKQPVFLQPDVECPVAHGQAYSACIHGGESRQFFVPGETSCQQLQAHDSIGAFHWRCYDLGGEVRFVSGGLRTGRGLADLVVAQGFRPLSILVESSGAPVAWSESQIWWDNPVLPLPDNSTSEAAVESLTQANAIYVLQASRGSMGYNIAANGVAVVTLADAVLGLRAEAVPNCNRDTGGTGPNDVDPFIFRPCLLAAGSQRRLWIEAALENQAGQPSATDYHTALLLQSVEQAVVRRTTTQNGCYGLLAVDLSSSRLAHLRLANHSKYGAIFNHVSDLVVHDVNINNTGRGSGNAGLLLQSGSTGNIFTQIFVTAAQPYGVLYYAGGNHLNTWSHVSVMNSGGRGFTVDSVSNTLVHLATINNAGTGLKLNSRHTHISQLVSLHNSGAGVAIGATSAENVFSDAVLLGDNTQDCDISSVPVNPGLGTGGSGLCTNQGSSSAALVFDQSAAQSFVGVVDGDAVNGSDGPAQYSSVDDWLNFQSPWRGWAIAAPTFPAAELRAPCVPHAVTCPEPCLCEIRDWSLNGGDTTLLNQSGLAQGASDPFVPKATCPAAAAGTWSHTDRLGNIFLVNALEILSDGHGDDDGLCESHEACVYSPNLGAFQGDGPIVEQGCLFSDSGVGDVTLYGRLVQ